MDKNELIVQKNILLMQAEAVRTGSCSQAALYIIACKLKAAVAGGLLNWQELEISPEKVDSILSSFSAPASVADTSIEPVCQFLTKWRMYKDEVLEIEELHEIFLKIRRLLAQQKLKPEDLAPLTAGDWFSLCQCFSDLKTE